jgi:hypothetical protein
MSDQLVLMPTVTPVTVVPVVPGVSAASSGSTDTSGSLAIWADWHSGDGVGRAVVNSRYCAQIASEEKLFGGWQLSSEGARVRPADPSPAPWRHSDWQ